MSQPNHPFSPKLSHTAKGVQEEERARALFAFRSLRNGPGKGYAPGFYNNNTTLHEFEELLKEQNGFKNSIQDPSFYYAGNERPVLEDIPIPSNHSLSGGERSAIADIPFPEEGVQPISTKNKSLEDLYQQKWKSKPHPKYLELARRGESIHRGMQDTVSQNKQSLKDDELC